MASNNAKLAYIFQQMGDVLEIIEGNPFRITAFHKAARVLADLPTDVATLDHKQLTEVDGIGKGTAERIAQFLAHGIIAEHEELMATVPPGLLDLLAVPGLGPKTIAQLWKQAGVTDTATLKLKLETGELEHLPRLGPKKLENLKANLAFATTVAQRSRLGSVMPFACWFVDQLRQLKPVKQVAFAGSLRRGAETVGDLDLLVAAAPKDAAKIADAFVKLEPVAEILAQGPTKSSIRTRDRLQVDLRIVELPAFGAALLYFTGSKDHNVRLRERAISMGFKLSEYGLFSADTNKRVAGATEEDVYKALGLAWIPPELREARNEITLAEKNKLPKLLTLDDIKAELHTHTTASDGHWSIRELAAAAVDRGFHTVAITDHSKGQVQANGLSPERLEKHIQAVRDIAAEMKGTINVLAGSEVDILTDGRLDYPDSLLKELDIVVASPHASLSQDSATATKRFLKAIQNRYVTIIGHLTGRLINRREGLHPDINQLFQAAAERGIAMEINANHYRLDLRDTHARAAIDAGVKLSINTDAHGPADLDQLIYGVLTARRAGATKTHVINCLSRDALMKWIRSTRP